MIDDALRAIVDLVTSLTGAQAVINVFPAIQESHIESTELLPRPRRKSAQAAVTTGKRRDTAVAGSSPGNPA